MLFRTLGLCLLLVSSHSFAVGRSPAVEDFVGIEVDHPESTPQGSESLFNLEKDIQRIETNDSKPKLSETRPVQASTGASLPAILGFVVILGLPILSWLMMMNHMRKIASVESASNIEVLEKYRKERELAKKRDSEIRKAS